MTLLGKSQGDIDKGVKGEGQLLLGMLVAFVNYLTRIYGILVSPEEVSYVNYKLTTVCTVNFSLFTFISVSNLLLTHLISTLYY